MDVIKPTNGRIVWYTPHETEDDAMSQFDPSQELTAQVCHVWDDRKVNLVITDSEGDGHFRSKVQLVQKGDKKPSAGGYAEWMPYQQKAAEKRAIEDAEEAKGL